MTNHKNRHPKRLIGHGSSRGDRIRNQRLETIQELRAPTVESYLAGQAEADIEDALDAVFERDQQADMWELESIWREEGDEFCTDCGRAECECAAPLEFEDELDRDEWLERMYGP